MDYIETEELKDVTPSEYITTDMVVGEQLTENENIIDLAKNLTKSGLDVDKAALIIEDFRKKQALRLSNVYIFGPMMLWYAYRGKITKVERGLLLLMGVSSMYMSYQDWRMNNQGIAKTQYLKDFVASFTSGGKSEQV